MNFENIKLVPRFLSTIKSRDDVDLSIPFGNQRLNIPLLHSPMDTIGGLEMCRLFLENSLLGCFPKITELDQICRGSIVSVGLNDLLKINLLYHKYGIRYFLIDVANGFNSNVVDTIKYLKEDADTFIITGNVASKEGYQYLANLGVDAVRVGIGVGSHCLTTNNTGIGCSLVDSVIECYEASLEMENPPLIIADGGIRQVGDIVKILAVGADLVMIGSLFAGTKETPGEVVMHEGEKFKVYRGSASYASQTRFKTAPYYIEGEETMVRYKGSAQKVLDKIDAGLRSAFSYLGASNMEEFKRISKECIKNV